MGILNTDSALQRAAGAAATGQSVLDSGRALGAIGEVQPSGEGVIDAQGILVGLAQDEEEARFLEMPPEGMAPMIISIAAANASKAEGNTGVTLFTFTVTRTLTPYQDGRSIVSYDVTGSAGSTATAADFEGAALPTGTIGFAAGETSKTLTVPVQGDTDVENDEGFTVTISNPVNATLGIDTAVGIIWNDDEEPLIPFNPSVDDLLRVRAVWDGSKPAMLLVAKLSGDTGYNYYYVTYDAVFKNHRKALSFAGAPSITPILYNGSIHIVDHKSTSKTYLTVSQTTTVAAPIDSSEGAIFRMVAAPIGVEASPSGLAFVYRDGWYVKEGAFDGANAYEIGSVSTPTYDSYAINGFAYSDGEIAYTTFTEEDGPAFWYGRKGESWSSAQVSFINNILLTELAPNDAHWMESIVDSQDNLYVLFAYYELPSDAFSIRLFKRTYSGTWSSEKNFITFTTYEGDAIGFAIDTNNFLHISWSGSDGLNYSSNKTGSWVTQSNIANKTVGHYHENADLVLDGDNTAHIIYFDRVTSPASQTLSHISI
jgi:hypothetical protein